MLIRKSLREEWKGPFSGINTWIIALSDRITWERQSTSPSELAQVEQKTRENLA
mgnify:CR=1 FL=1